MQDRRQEARRPAHKALGCTRKEITKLRLVPWLDRKHIDESNAAGLHSRSPTLDFPGTNSRVTANLASHDFALAELGTRYDRHLIHPGPQRCSGYPCSLAATSAIVFPW